MEYDKCSILYYDGAAVCYRCSEIMTPNTWPAKGHPVVATCKKCGRKAMASLEKSEKFHNEVGVFSFDEVQDAVISGLNNNSYRTLRAGWVPSYSGECEFDFAGKKFRAKGYGPTGTATELWTRGYIEIRAL